MTKAVPLAMIIETILISNLDNFDGERNALMVPAILGQIRKESYVFKLAMLPLQNEACGVKQ